MLPSDRRKRIVRVQLPKQMGWGFRTALFDPSTTVLILKANIIEKIRANWSKSNIFPITEFDLCIDSTGSGRLEESALVSSALRAAKASIESVNISADTKAASGSIYVLHLVPNHGRVQETLKVTLNLIRAFMRNLSTVLTPTSPNSPQLEPATNLLTT